MTAPRVWQRWASDITHVNGCPYLSVTDSASGFTMWRRLRSETAKEVTGQFHELFSEFGSPESILTDNGTVYRSRDLELLLQHWEVAHDFSCAYRPQGNGTVERVHRTVKRSAARAGVTVEDIVFWLNNSARDRKVSPYELLFGARSQKPGVSATRVEVDRAVFPDPLGAAALFPICRNPFVVGDVVYLRRPDGRCDREWSGPHRVTALNSGVSIVLDDDGISRHISHVRRVPQPLGDSSDEDSEESVDSEASATIGHALASTAPVAAPGHGNHPFGVMTMTCTDYVYYECLFFLCSPFVKISRSWGDVAYSSVVRVY